MAITPRGGSPATASGTGPISVTLTGSRQPQAGDVLLIIHGNDYYQLSNMSTPTVDGSTTGVEPVVDGAADGGNLFAHAKSYTYIVAGTGDLTVASNETGSADEEKCLAVYVLSGVDTTTPIDIAGNNSDSTGSTTSRVCPSVNATTADGFAIYHSNDGNGSDGGPHTWPGGTTEQYDATVGGFMYYTGATEQLAASGATGTRTATATDNASYASLTIVMRTAAGGAAADPGVPNLRGPAPGRIAPNGRREAWRGTDPAITAGTAHTVDQTDGAGLTDSIVIDRANTVTDTAGLTDSTVLDRASVHTDSAGLTDTATAQAAKHIAADDTAGLTDTVAYSYTQAVTDSAGLTDNLAQQRTLASNDAAGLTDQATAQKQNAQTTTDDTGLTDTTTLDRSATITDTAGLTDTATTEGGTTAQPPQVGIDNAGRSATHDGETSGGGID